MIAQTACNSGALTTATPNDILIGFCGLQHSQTTLSAGSGWSHGSSSGVSSGINALGEIQIAATTGNYTATSSSYATSSEQATIEVAFKATTGGVSGFGGTLNIGSALIDPRAFGAKCDGATNDTTVFENAISAAAGGSGIVLVPAATTVNPACLVNIRINTGSNGNVTIQGFGKRASFPGPYSNSLPVIQVDSTNNPIQNVGIQDRGFINSNNYSVPAISFTRTPVTLSITGFSITSNIVTFDCNNTYTAGQQVYVTGLSTGTYLNNTVFTVNTSTGTTFTAGFNHANVAHTTDSGTVQALSPGINGYHHLSRLFIYGFSNSLSITTAVESSKFEQMEIDNDTGQAGIYINSGVSGSMNGNVF